MSEHIQGHGPSVELITGATGLVGMYRLAWRLERGMPTVALRREGSNVERTRVFLQDKLGSKFEEAWRTLKWREADLSDPLALEEAMEGCERVFHAAGRVSFKPGDEAALKTVNEKGTANVVNAALASGVKRLIHMSSVAALGRSHVGEGAVDLTVTEGSDWADGAGASPYGVSKHAAEMQAWRGMAEGLDLIVVNPTIILGDARYEESSGMVYRRAAQGRKYHPAGGNGFVGAEDLIAVCSALDAAADAGQKGILGERFVVSSENVTYRDLMGWVAEGMGVEPPSKVLENWMLELGWRLARVWSVLSRKPPILTKDLARNTRRQHRYDTSKLRSALPEFAFTPIREVVKETTSSFS